MNFNSHPISFVKLLKVPILSIEGMFLVVVFMAGFLISVIGGLAGIACLLLQSYGYLKNGLWTPIETYDILELINININMDFSNAETWIGLSNIIDNVLSSHPMSILPVIGLLVMIFASAFMSYRDI